MYVVIFKAEINILDQDYFDTAQRLRTKAFDQYHCIKFESFCENGNECALSYWHSLNDIRNWQQDIEHQHAQQQGQKRWYKSYTVEICELNRQYSSA